MKIIKYILALLGALIVFGALVVIHAQTPSAPAQKQLYVDRVKAAIPSLTDGQYAKIKAIMSQESKDMKALKSEDLGHIDSQDSASLAILKRVMEAQGFPADDASVKAEAAAIKATTVAALRASKEQYIRMKARNDIRALLTPEQLAIYNTKIEKVPGYASGQAAELEALRKKAEQGDAEAQLNLGTMYGSGRDGAGQNATEAIKWLRKAADQGEKHAQNYLGIMYSQGRGVAKDEAEGVKWFRKAAEQGYAESQCYLGIAYLYGIGVSRDVKQAKIWLKKSAAQKDAKAAELLRSM